MREELELLSWVVTIDIVDADGDYYNMKEVSWAWKDYHIKGPLITPPIPIKPKVSRNDLLDIDD